MYTVYSVHDDKKKKFFHYKSWQSFIWHECYNIYSLNIMHEQLLVHVHVFFKIWSLVCLVSVLFLNPSRADDEGGHDGSDAPSRDTGHKARRLGDGSQVAHGVETPRNDERPEQHGGPPRVGVGGHVEGPHQHKGEHVLYVILVASETRNSEWRWTEGFYLMVLLTL